MKKIKALSCLMILLISLFTLAGCKREEKEFSGSGITITLTSDFKVYESKSFTFYVESSEYAVMGNKETKESLAADYGDISLLNYISIILESSNLTSTSIYSYSSPNLSFKYSYYTTYKDGVDTFGYMLVVLESDTSFYTVNLCCDYDVFDSSKEQLMKYAMTLSVE